MNNNPTRQELENQIAELKKQNDILRLHTAIQNEEEKTEDSEKYTPTIFNNMGDSVFVKDDQSRLVLVNDAFCEIFGLPRAAIIGKTLAEDVAPEERESFLKIDNQVLSDGIENINEESLTVRGGQTLIISTRKSRFIDSNGNRFLVGVIRDITENKKAEAALKESEARFRELNATKDKLFSIIAHDLKSPFHNILGLSDLLLKTAKELEDANTKKYLELINSTTKNTLSLLDNLLDWAKSQTGQVKFKSENINLYSSIQKVLELSNPIAKTKNISLNQVASDKIEIYSDEKILNTVLRNLISNAIKFTNPKGKISVFTIIKQNQVEITVSDNGVGMNDKTCKKLFGISSNISTPGTSKEQGSGLGLVLCKEFVEKLGGKIWVKSEEGKGSDFKFTLPLKSSK